MSATRRLFETAAACPAWRGRAGFGRVSCISVPSGLVRPGTIHLPKSSSICRSAPASLSTSFCLCWCSRPVSPPTSRRMLEDAAPILLLAIVATLITTAVIGLALWPLAGVPLVVCLLLGAVVATTDPAAVIAIFRDVGAPARLTRLVEGEALLNDAAAIALFAVLLGMIVAAREPDIGSGLSEFFLSFVGGGLLGLLAGRALLAVNSMGSRRPPRGSHSDPGARLRRLHHRRAPVSCIGRGRGAGVGADGQRARPLPDRPYNWSFLTDLWDQIAFWARSLVFILASILVPRLLGDIGLHDLLLLAVLIAAAFAARILVLFVLMPPLEYFKLTQPISSAYKLAIIWGGLRGALTLVLALAAPRTRRSIRRSSALSRCSQPASCCSHCSSTARHCAWSSLCSGSTVCRRETRSCATAFWRFPMPRFAIRCATWRKTMRSPRAGRAGHQAVPSLDCGGERPRCGGTADRAGPAGDRSRRPGEPGARARSRDARRPDRFAGDRASVVAECGRLIDGARAEGRLGYRRAAKRRCRSR